MTEPTPFTLHGLKLVVETARKPGVRFGMVLNRTNIGDDEADRCCQEDSIPTLMRIPYDRAIAEACSREVPNVKARPECVAAFKQLLEDVGAEASQ